MAWVRASCEESVGPARPRPHMVRPPLPEIVILYTTWPDAETAEAAGAEAVAERLAACANLGAPIRSVYRWQGAVERAAEVPMMLKTTAAMADALKDFLVARHPHD